MKRQINVTSCYLQELTQIICLPLNKIVHVKFKMLTEKKSMCELHWNKEEGEDKTSTSC
jgi:hypothetical protein